MNYNKVLNAQAAFVNHSAHRERGVDCFCVHVLMVSSSNGKLACDTNLQCHCCVTTLQMQVEQVL